METQVEKIKNGVEIYKNLRDSFPLIHFYMLADQTYSSCCVDEITAKHVPPELIIHFGDACLSITSHQYKVLYAFGESSLINYQQVVEKLKFIIKQSGRKYYVVSIGRISPPKLANFASIQAWVLISCYYNAIIDNKEFFQPIITPMECYIACLQPSSYKYSTNLQDFIDLKINTKDFDNIDICGQENLIEWKGLELKSLESISTKIIEGQSGIAESYNTERNID
ncbi:hypothetical protein MXB_4060 [Myxobolus squamalis]|nr:hypothetical protein MXB_4060 [Myxobolus squamalis]